MNKTGITAPEVLLPALRVDMQKWAVVACDQFTSEPEYWEKLEAFVGDSPSALAVTFPEVYLSDNNAPRIAEINRTMRRYIESGVFRAPVHGFILTDRQTAYAPHRLGLVAAVDLEAYSYTERNSLIRATEGTILSRIPPRVRIREQAPLELPHSMLLLDDRERTVIEPLYAARHAFQKLYDFDLNMGGGHITGWLVPEGSGVERALEKLLEPSLLQEKYGSDTPFLFAVGDGNHSLATAKACWEQLKPGLTQAERETHPARYALAEIVNVFDDGLTFEPIHRVVFKADAAFLEGLKRLSGAGAGIVVTGTGDTAVSFPATASAAVAEVQAYIDGAIAAGHAEKADYVHGEASVREIVARCPGSAGILLPKMKKEDLFGAVAKNGALPRKTFSMGEATEKRYYLEARKITGGRDKENEL